MPSVNDIIAAARECLGTPFHHQGRLLGVGIDCVGLAMHPVTKFNLPVEDFATYSREPNPQMMASQLKARVQEVFGTPQPGNILWLEVDGDPKHLAILTRDNTIVHAVASGPQKVIEHSFRAPWPSRVKGIFVYPGITE